MNDVVTGWSSLVRGGPWVGSRIEVDRRTLRVHPDGWPGPLAVELANVVGLDELEGDDPRATVLEFEFLAGASIRLRVPEPFVDVLVGALRSSREPEPGDVEASDVEAFDVDPSEDERDEPDEPAASRRVELPPPPPPARSNTKSALAAEVAALRDYIEGLGLADLHALQDDLETLQRHRADALADLRAATAARRAEEVALVRVRRDAILQDAGIYRPRHPAEDAPALAARLDAVHRRIETLVREGTPITTTDDWTVNGSRSEGRKVTDELAALLLRTYNAEADVLLQSLEPEGLDAAIDRLSVTRATIERLGVSMRIELSDELHDLRVEELTLAADQLAAEREERRRHTALAPSDHDHLVVTSNVGSLGPDLVRIATTSARNRDEAVADADAGRLPFPSDLHALVPCADVDAVLAALRERFVDERCNLDDPAATWFRVAPVAVRDALIELGVAVTWFTVDAHATDWHRSERSRAGRHDAA